MFFFFIVMQQMTTQRQCKGTNKKTGSRCRNKVSGKFQYCSKHRPKHRKTNKAAAASNGIFSNPLRQQQPPNIFKTERNIQKQRSKIVTDELKRRNLPVELQDMIKERAGDLNMDPYQKAMTSLQIQIKDDKLMIKGIPSFVREAMGVDNTTFVLSQTSVDSKNGHTFYELDVTRRGGASVSTRAAKKSVERQVESPEGMMKFTFNINDDDVYFNVTLFTLWQRFNNYIDVVIELSKENINFVAEASPQFSGQGWFKFAVLPFLRHSILPFGELSTGIQRAARRARWAAKDMVRSWS